MSHPKCRGKTQQNSISNTYTPSAKQGGPEQPRGSPQRSRSVVHRRLPKDAAVQKREATKRGLRSAAALTIRNALRTNKTKTNRQYYRHFKIAASKHCYGLASHAMLHPKAQDTSIHNHKSCRYQAYRSWFRHFKDMKPNFPKQIKSLEKPRLPYQQLLRFGSLNCKGIKPSGEDVKQRVLINAMKQHNIEILFLQETHINTNSIEHFLGYTFIYSSNITDAQRKQADTARAAAKNRPHGKGRGPGVNIGGGQPAVDREFHGVGVIVSPLAKLYLNDFEQIDSRLMCVTLSAAGPPIHFINGYAPQSGTSSFEKEAFYEKLENLHNQFPRAHPTFILGDFNARLHCRCDHEFMIGPHVFGRGRDYLIGISDQVMENRRLFLNFCAGCDLYIMNTWFHKPAEHQITFREPSSQHEPPWVPSRFAQIDFVLAPNRWKNTIQDVTSRSNTFTDSDHYIVTADCRVKLMSRSKADRTPRYRPPTPREKLSFNSFIAESLRVLSEPEVACIMQIIQSAAKNCFTEFPNRQRNAHISDRTWQKILRRNAAHAAENWVLVAQLSREIKRDARQDKRNSLLVTLQQCQTEREKWEGPKILRSKKIIHFTKLLDRHGNRVGPSQRPEAIADFLHHTQWTPANVPPYQHRPKILNIDLGINVGPLTVSEVSEAIQKMKKGKAAGHDQISIDWIKALDSSNTEILTSALNKWWSQEYLPGDYLKAMVVSIYKKGNTQDISNYRPISLLTCAYKIFASILQSRLSIAIDPHLSTTQYGFRPARSTQQPLYIARRIQDTAEQSGNNTVLCFLDWEKAFDKINHERMFEALSRMNIPAKMIRVLQALYTCPTFQVEHDEFKSNVYEQRAGIRQGCPLSPYLFVIVMSVMFADIRSEHHRRLATGKLDHLLFMEILYADDTLLISKNTRTMNILLHAVETESAYYGLKLNQSKCAVVNMNGNNMVRFKDGTPVPKENQVTYLGGIITREARGHVEVEQRIAATMATWKRMHLFFNDARCPIRWKLIVYNSMIRSKLLYGLETVELSPALLTKLETFQIKGLRKILHMKPPFINRRNTNAEVYRRTREACESRYNPTSSLVWNIRQCITEKRIKLTGHILRTDASDPMRQVSFRRNSATPYTPAFRRPGRPRKNWLQTSLAMCWNKLKDTPFTNNAEQQQEILDCALHRLF